MSKLKKALWLHQYIMSLFGGSPNDFKAFSEPLKDAQLEGWTEQNRSHFFDKMQYGGFASNTLTVEQLRTYDENIYRHTQRISEKRNEPIQWKYFQYLSLLFTEIYLDRYFHDPEGLLADLNGSRERIFGRKIEATNLFGESISLPTKSKGGKGVSVKPDFSISDFRFDVEKNDLNKLAYWNATGSGKTLLMHVNILQYQHYLELHGKTGSLNRIIVLTPNEGLSRQHLTEFQASGLDAEMFSKTTSGNVMRFARIEIIDIHKLGEKSGEKTIAVEAFESNNLVLVDEGHRGSSGDIWMNYRNALSRTGFSFEYSATFGQAVNAQSGEMQRKLLNEYGKSVIFDYSYKYFYEDGYGKDYQILNLDEDRDEARQLYLTACLLQFYEQVRYFEEYRKDVEVFNIERPLAIFVGGTVNAVRKEKGEQVSDVVFMLQFLDRFVQNKSGETERFIHRVLKTEDALVDNKGISILQGKLHFLKNLEENEFSIFHDLLRRVFHSPTAAHLVLDNLKSQDGEIGLRIGSNKYFGVINVGDDAELMKLCDSKGLQTSVQEMSDSLFRSLNAEKSDVHLLIGSKKFTEGWSSWRVSTMGLMNVGRSEGSEIIQLFGRGVRLKGYKMSLKRSAAMKDDIPFEIRKRAVHLPILETLNVFGLRADYMAQFKKFLEEEGVPKNDGTDNIEKINLPILPTFDWNGSRQLKYLKERDGAVQTFKKEITVQLTGDCDFPGKVFLDWYPRVQRIGNNLQSKSGIDTTAPRTLGVDNLAFLDWDSIWLTMQQYKSERGWHNFIISRIALREAMQNAAERGSRNMDVWYRLMISEEELRLSHFDKVAEWQEIAVRLLKGYCERSYNFAKNDYLKDKMETAVLTPEHENFFAEYEVFVERSQTELMRKLTGLKAELENKTFRQNLKIGTNFDALYFDRHLYQPLLFLDGKQYGELVQIQPVALNEGEMQFVEDLKQFHTSTPSFFLDKEIYLLRNKSRSGVTFFDANGGFSPDFLLWIFWGDKQHITFVDPKGFHNLGSLDHAKVTLNQRLKFEVEPKLEDKNVSLNSFLVSTTEWKEIKWKRELSMFDFNSKGVFFQKDQRATYIESIIIGALK